MIKLICVNTLNKAGYFQGFPPGMIPVARFSRNETEIGRISESFCVNIRDGRIWDIEGPYETKRYKCDGRVVSYEIVRKKLYS